MHGEYSRVNGIWKVVTFAEAVLDQPSFSVWKSMEYDKSSLMSNSEDQECSQAIRSIRSGERCVTCRGACEP